MKMNPHVAEVYFQEIDNHARWALESFDRMRLVNDPAARLAAAHQALGHAAVVSRFLWPEEMVAPKDQTKQRGHHRRAMQRGQALRELLELEADHPLDNRALRLHVVLFEDRIDEWIESDLDNIVKPAKGNTPVSHGPIVEDVMRYLNAEKGEFQLRGHKFNLAALSDGLQDLRGRIALQLAREMGLASGALL